MTRGIASKLVATTALASVLLVHERATAQSAYEIVHSFPAQPAWIESKLLQGTDGVFYGTTIGSAPTFGDAAPGAAASTVFALRPRLGGGFTLTVLHAFDETQGVPSASLIQARDGDLYGTTSGGNTGGTVFKVSPAGVFTTLNVLAHPKAPLVQAADGSFYGTTTQGGAADRGTVFRMTAEGSLTILHSFTGGAGGSSPDTPLIQASDGDFYGTTGFQSFDSGTIFRITPDGTLTTLHTFDDFLETSLGGLVQGIDGNFYGMSSQLFSGETKAFRITPSGSFTQLHAFTQSEGLGGEDLIQASDGNFYGTMSGGGAGPNPDGTVFRMTPAGEVTVLHTFNVPEGGGTLAGLIQAQDGLLYGVIGLGGPDRRGTVFSMSTAGAFTTAYALRNSPQGCGPWGGLIQTGDGSFYGTTVVGGTANKGTVFKMTGDGTVTTLHSFTGSDGAIPYASLLHASDGNFYGTTHDGGSANKGTVYKMTPGGVVTTLLSFSASTGELPWAPLIQASDGKLYGTASYGPNPVPLPLPQRTFGSLFRMSLSGSNFERFYTFRGSPGVAAYPTGPLMQARDGFLYGTTYGNFASSVTTGGSVFRVIPGGIELLSTGGINNHITAGLTEGSDGALYSASFGFPNGPPVPPEPPEPPQHVGSVFKITPGGVKTVLHTFDSNWTEGIRPFNAPIEASDGNFYGTTHRYGNDTPLTARGSIYRVTPAGDFATLKTVTYAEGAHPSGKLLQASDGAIYGVSYMGGAGDCGVIFRFTTPSSGEGPLPTVSSQP